MIFHFVQDTLFITWYPNRLYNSMKNRSIVKGSHKRPQTTIAHDRSYRNCSVKKVTRSSDEGIGEEFSVESGDRVVP